MLSKPVLPPLAWLKLYTTTAAEYHITPPPANQLITTYHTLSQPDTIVTIMWNTVKTLSTLYYLLVTWICSVVFSHGIFNWNGLVDWFCNDTSFSDDLKVVIILIRTLWHDLIVSLSYHKVNIIPIVQNVCIVQEADMLPLWDAPVPLGSDTWLLWAGLQKLCQLWGSWQNWGGNQSIWL